MYTLDRKCRKNQKFWFELTAHFSFFLINSSWIVTKKERNFRLLRIHSSAEISTIIKIHYVTNYVKFFQLEVWIKHVKTIHSLVKVYHCFCETILFKKRSIQANRQLFLKPLPKTCLTRSLNNGTIQSDVLCGLKKVGTKGDMGNNILYSLLLYQPNPCTVNLANSSVLNSNNSKVVFLERDKDKKQETCEYSALVNTTTTNVTRYLVFGFNGGNLNAQAPTDSSVVFIPIAFSKRIIVTS